MYKILVFTFFDSKSVIFLQKLSFKVFHSTFKITSWEGTYHCYCESESGLVYSLPDSSSSPRIFESENFLTKFFSWKIIFVLFFVDPFVKQMLESKNNASKALFWVPQRS